MNDILHHGLSDQGKVRPHNEDRFVAAPEMGLFLVSDGMGGAKGGEVASGIVVEALPVFVRFALGLGGKEFPKEYAQGLTQAFVNCNQRLLLETRRNNNLEGMGATAVMALVREGFAVVAHVGDSRAYLWRAGNIVQLTKDHSLVRELVDDGKITEAEALVHPMRSHITQCMGMKNNPSPSIQRIAFHPGDVLLLCSDGLTGMVPDAKIAACIAKFPDLKDTARNLVGLANLAGGKDNITVLLIKRI